VEIEVTFDISADGIVGVAAKDIETGQSQSITVTATSGLTEDEIKKIMDENLDTLLEHKQDDEFVKQKNSAEAIIGQIESMVPAGGRRRRSILGARPSSSIRSTGGPGCIWT